MNTVSILALLIIGHVKQNNEVLFFADLLYLNGLSYNTHWGQGRGEAILPSMAGGSKNDTIC